MSARRGDLHRAFRLRLSLHLREVQRTVRHAVAVFKHSGLYLSAAGEVVDQLKNVLDGVNLQPVHHRAFVRVHRRDIELFQPQLTCRDRHRQYAVDPAQFTRQGQLADKRTVIGIGADLPRRLQHGHQYRQVVQRSFLLDIRGRKVDDQT